MMTHRTVVSAMLVTALAVPAAIAGGFAVDENSAADLGRANAGRATQTTDASAAFTNPALLTRFDGPMVSGTLSGNYIISKFRDEGSVNVLGIPLAGNDENFLKDAVVPALYVVYPISERLAAGVAVNAPFDAVVKYDGAWPGRYQAIESKLETFNLNPSLAYALSENLSIGAGISFQYAKGRFTNAIDFGVVCLEEAGPTVCVPAGLVPQASDGRLIATGDDWKIGWNIGAAWSPSDDWTFGIHYRSGINHKLEGKAQFAVPATATLLTAGGAFVDTNGSTDLNLPASLDIGAAWTATDRVTLYGSAMWTNWSVNNNATFRFENPLQPAATEVQKFKNAWRYAIGADYTVTDVWTVRAGFAIDKTPINSSFQTARVPDGDRQVYAIGASWAILPGWQADFSYNRVDIDKSNFSRVGTFGESLNGEYSSNADVLAIGLSKRF